MTRLHTALAILLFSPTITAFAQDGPVPKRGPVKLTEAALKLHREALVFDGHNDLPWQFRGHNDRYFQRFDIARPQPKLHTDIARLRKGDVGAQFWSAYVPAETARTGTAVKETLEQIDLIHRLVKAYPDTLGVGADRRRRRAHPQGRARSRR